MRWAVAIGWVTLGACRSNSPSTLDLAVTAQLTSPPAPYAGVTRCGSVDSSHVRRPRAPRSLAPATMSFVDGKIEGSSDGEAINRRVKASHHRFRLCYARQLARDPELAGTVLMKFQVGDDGATARIEIHGFDPTIDRCVCDIVARIQFPRQIQAPVVVSYPLIFGH